ncbi:MAG: glycosyltransferase family 2 protein [Lachnospiraceae bacterium]|nr:glycosyltransferase family 2 protein [Lachnospiraceae bacterium]
MHTDLSISIVVYRDAEAAERAVRSIEEQTAVSVTKALYVIDNGAAEYAGDREGFRAFLRQYPDVTYIAAPENLGYGAANNLVLPLLDSDFHAVLNPDIELREDAFSSILDFMRQKEDCGMVIPRLTDEEGRLQKAYRRELTVADLVIRYLFPNGFRKRQDRHTMQDMDYTQPFCVPFGQGSFLVIRTELFRKLKGFDERFFLYMEDADLCRRVNEISSLLYFPGATVIHGWERSSYRDKTLFRIHLRSMRQYFSKWGWKLF